MKDAILAHAGNLAGVDVIITRNTKDFKHSLIKVVDPTEFLAALNPYKKDFELRNRRNRRKSKK